MTGLLQLSGERQAYVFNSETVQFHNHTTYNHTVSINMLFDEVGFIRTDVLLIFEWCNSWWSLSSVKSNCNRNTTIEKSYTAVSATGIWSDCTQICYEYVPS